MIVELAQDIFSKEGILALVLIIVLVNSVIMSVALYKLVSRKDKGDDTVSTQAEVIAQLVSPVKKIAESLQAVSEAQEAVSRNLLEVARLLNEHDARVTDMRTTLNAAILEMNETTAERDRQIKELPGRVKDEMAQDLEKIPKAVEEALAPKIEAIKIEIGVLIQSLDESLTERIETATDRIPNRTTELVRNELAALKRTIETSLKDMLETAKNVQIPDEPAETTISEPEPAEREAKKGN